MHEIKPFFLCFVQRLLRRLLSFVILGGLFLFGLWCYDCYEKKRVEWRSATRYFRDGRQPETAVFAVEDDVLKTFEHCLKSVRTPRIVGSGSMCSRVYVHHCVESYDVYRTLSGKDFKRDDVARFEIQS